MAILADFGEGGSDGDSPDHPGCVAGDLAHSASERAKDRQRSSAQTIALIGCLPRLMKTAKPRPIERELCIGYSNCYWCQAAERTICADPEIWRRP